MQIDKVPLPIDRLPQDAPELLHITVIGESPIRSSGVIETPERTTLDKHGVGEDWLAKAEAAQPMGQLVKPDQLAGLVAYLLRPESGVMTGALVF